MSRRGNFGGRGIEYCLISQNILQKPLSTLPVPVPLLPTRSWALVHSANHPLPWHYHKVRDAAGWREPQSRAHQVVSSPGWGDPAALWASPAATTTSLLPSTLNTLMGCSSSLWLLQNKRSQLYIWKGSHHLKYGGFMSNYLSVTNSSQSIIQVTPTTWIEQCHSSCSKPLLPYIICTAKTNK